MAIKHGYFKQYGIKLEWDDIDTTANVIALLAQDRYQIVAGGISAGIFQRAGKESRRHHPVRPRLDADRAQSDAASGPQ